MNLPRTLQDLQANESASLATYAIHCGNIHGRKLPEEPHPFRTEFQRDRDRILHSHAFRRLEYKTQVFLSGTGDHLRNRLTHTIEVAGIARTIARALGANEDLTEAIALAHDLGHSPFGHVGERTLHRLMEDFGGFDHNLQALRIVDLLEIKYPGYDGLNLTWELRTGLMKHRSKVSPATLDGIELPPAPSIEAQIADLADDLTYYGHDVDDGLTAGILTQDKLSHLAIWQLATEEAKTLGLSPNDSRFETYAIRALINMMVVDLIKNSACRLQKCEGMTSDDIQTKGLHPIAFSQDFQTLTDELCAFLYKDLYFCHEFDFLNTISKERMTLLFRRYIEKPELMGHEFMRRIAICGLHRTIADYIAGMTDNFATSEFERLK